MSTKTGDLSIGDTVLIPAEKRHVYTYKNPHDGTRGCQFCDLKHTKKDGHWPADPEQACPGR